MLVYCNTKGCAYLEETHERPSQCPLCQNSVLLRSFDPAEDVLFNRDVLQSLTPKQHRIQWQRFCDTSIEEKNNDPHWTRKNLELARQEDVYA